MAQKKGIAVSKKGMNRDSHPAELGKEEYSFALNANIHDEHGNGKVLLQNEPSNLKCSDFKEGFKVVGYKYDINGDKTYFFITNPDTNISEIGYISSNQVAPELSPTEQGTPDNLSAVLETPLEQTIQEPLCEYVTLLSDYCELTETATGCLNFSLDFPIFPNNIHIKHENTGITIYFTDDLNPQRYIQLDDLEQYNQDVDDCTGEVTETCLQCNKMRIFKLHNKPCLHPRIIQNGGNLRAGQYEALISFCDFSGNELTDYFAITNPIPIFDKNNLILDQTLLDYATNQAISIDVFGADTRFEYYKIVVIYRSGLDSSTINFVNGVYPIETTNFTIYTSTDKQKVDLKDILAKRTIYTKARGLAAANNVLYHYGLTQHRVVNLQQVVNLMGSLVRWSTVQAREGLYEDGVFVSNYKGHMRDEVYPLSIRFFINGGYVTNNFIFIPRPPSAFEIEELDAPGSTFVSNTNTNSVLAYNPKCTEDARNKRWQFENTATVFEGFCTVPANGNSVVTEEREEDITCTIVDFEGNVAILDTISSSSITLTTMDDLVSYINTHIDEIIASTGTNGADIRGVLESPSDYPESCTPDFGDNCSEDVTLVSEEMFAISVDTEVVGTAGKDFGDYDRVQSPSICSGYQYEDDGVTLIQDTTFQTNYMEPGETVYLRTPNPTNISCGSAIQLSANIALPNTNYLINKGEVGAFGTLQTALNASQTSLDATIEVTGTSGTANVTIGGVDYLMTFNTNLTTTASDFVTLHAAAILSTHNITVTSSTFNLLLDGDYETLVVTNLTGDLDGEISSIAFSDKIHSNGIWFKGSFNGQDSAIAELSPILCSFADDNSGTSFRLSVFETCADTSDLPTYSRIIADITTANDVNKFLEVLAVDFGGTTSNFFFVIDSPIKTRYISPNYVHTLTPNCGCFSIYQRQVETTTVINYTNLTFGKKQVWRSLCIYSIPQLGDCGPIPYQKGKFSYWESTQKYPCNNELYDSSELAIPDDIIPIDYRDEFEEYYVDNVVNNNYILSSEANFMDRPIRHYKFPDSTLVPFMSYGDQNPGQFQKSVIYPIGFFISNDVINAFLDIAVLNGLLTAEERNNITHYEIFRGDRRTDKSVIAKGLLYDIYNYTEENGDVAHYANYPLNSLGTDALNGGVPHPFGSNSNGKFTFHSPETSFFKPTLPRELRVEGYQFGNGANYFDEVEGHSTYVILGDRAYTLATTLAIIESAAELILQIGTWSVDAAAGGASAPGAILVAVALGITYTIAATFKAGQYRYQWLEAFRTLGKPNNFAYYQVCIGHYNYFLQNTVANSQLRGLTIDSYLPAGRWEVADESTGTAISINNIDREELVLLSMGSSSYNINYPTQYINYDNYSTNTLLSSRTRYSGTGRSGRVVSNAASPYTSLKQYLPSQYGDISSIFWINTGYCGNLTESLECDTIFGGDVFISRFSLKRKIPFFTTNAVNLPPLIPFKYSDYFNINPATESNRYFIDYLIDNDDNSSIVASLVFPSNRSNYNLDSVGSTSNDFYVRPPDKFYLFSYGIPYFLVESAINCDYRYAKREQHEQFYPQVGDAIRWTQEKNVSIKEKEEFFYNTTYSQEHTIVPWTMLPSNFKAELYEKLNDLSDATIYSRVDASQNSLVNPWLLYRALDTYLFPKNYGGLIEMSGIESEQILGRFQNGITIFGSVDLLADRITPDTKNLGTGGIFAGRNINFNTTELGYAGTQHRAKISCEFGHFWVDAKRGKVFQLNPNGQGLTEISKGANDSLEKWFKENLPFKILNSVGDLGELDVDNNFKGIGISMGWDDRLKRVFITKKDYIPKVDVCYSAGRFYDTSGFETLISQWESLGYTYTGIDRCRLRFTQEVNGRLNEYFADTREVMLGDLDYFEECSWTVAYSPLLKSWISYYSFKPDYYINYNDFFQTGLNFSNDENAIGLWSHFSFISSYQVFYGRLYPFIVEYPHATQLINSRLEAIEYWLDVRKYYNKYDYTDIYGIGFDRAIVYNSYQNSGQLNLVHQVLNDMRQLLIYPQYNADSVTVLQTEINSKWSFNHIFNHIRNEKSGLPLFLENCSQTDKVIDARLMDYINTYRDYMRGDYFLARLANYSQSRFKMIFRFSTEDRDFYQD